MAPAAAADRMIAPALPGSCKPAAASDQRRCRFQNRRVGHRGPARARHHAGRRVDRRQRVQYRPGHVDDLRAVAAQAIDDALFGGGGRSADRDLLDRDLRAGRFSQQMPSVEQHQIRGRRARARETP